MKKLTYEKALDQIRALCLELPEANEVEAPATNKRATVPQPTEQTAFEKPANANPIPVGNKPKVNLPNGQHKQPQRDANGFRIL